MKIAIPSMTLLSILVAVCSYFQLGFVPYLVSVIVVGVILLVAFKKIPQNSYPVYLVGFSLSMVIQQTMLGSYIVGTDIHQEFYMVNKTITDGWDWSYYCLNGTSVVLNVVAPFLDRIGIPVLWQFKLLYPIVLSFVPLVLYYAFSKQIGKQLGFYATIFFVIVPVFTVEIATINKSMVAELFFALVVLVLFSHIKNWKKFLLLSLFGILSLMCHYTVGTLVFGYLAITSIILVAYGIFKHKFNFVPVLGAVIVIGIVGGLWFYNTGGGIVYLGYTNSYTNVAKEVTESIVNNEPKVEREPIDNYLNHQDSLVKTALGMDFGEVSLSGKLFRVIQYVTQLAIILGFVFLIFLRKKHKVSIEFIAGLLASIVILVAVLFVPHIAAIVNTTRWYQSALFFASPLLVIGLWQIGKEKLTVCVLVVYYFFTSGFVFAVSDSEIPQTVIETPYSVAYSGQSGLIGLFNEDDVACAKWIKENIGKKQCHVGFTDTYLFLGYIEFNGQFVEKAPNEPHFLFLSSQNNKLQKMTTWTEPGMRKLLPLPDTTSMQEVFRQGDSVIYYVK